MAVVVNPEIQGQELTNVCTYCYLNEPLRAVVNETDLAASQIFVDIDIIDTENNLTVVETLVEYGVFDINPGRTIAIDLMDMSKQYLKHDVYKFSELNDIVNDGWFSIVSRYKFRFKIYSNVNTTPVEVYKLPIIGGRMFKDFTPVVNVNSPLNENQLYGLDNSNKWSDVPQINITLADPNITDSKPTITLSAGTGKLACGGYVVWKSRLGGYVSWGFDIRTQKFKHKYRGNIENSMFESTRDFNGSAFIPVNYTSVEYGYSATVKEIGLSQEELQAASGASGAVVIYLSQNGKLELCRITSVSSPLTSLGSGGNFSISLSSISMASQRTR